MLMEIDTYFLWTTSISDKNISVMNGTSTEYCWLCLSVRPIVHCSSNEKKGRSRFAWCQ